MPKGKVKHPEWNDKDIIKLFRLFQISKPKTRKLISL